MRTPFIIGLLLLFGVSTQAQPRPEVDFRYDHIILLVSNDHLKDSLDLIFTPAEKLTTEHPSQGTIGYYYLFYNTYIELLYLKNAAVASQNATSFGSDYAQRWGDDHSSSAIGFGLMAEPFEWAASHKDFHKYYNNDAPDSEYYLMSDFNEDLQQPLLYCSIPHRAYEAVTSIEDVKLRPKEIQEDLRNYLTHPEGIRSIREIVFKCPAELMDSGNLRLLEQTEVTIKEDLTASLTLVLTDKPESRKEFFINKHEKLILLY